MDKPTPCARAAYALEGVRVEPDRNALFAGGATVRVEPKVMDVLCALAGAGGEVVSREALIERIWDVEFGGDESVSRAVSLLRKALKEAGLCDGAIETVPKRGYRLTVPVTAAAPETDAPAASSHDPRSRLRTPWRLIIFASLLAVLAVGGALFAILRHESAARSEQPVVAVLPFDDLSPSGDYAWFAEGLADELINNLARVPDIVVIGRRSSFQFRETNLDSRSIGDRLGARYLIEGGVRRDGDHLRISASLVDTRNQATLWSETYERDGEDVFAVQAELARAIVRALNASMMAGVDPEELIGTKNTAAFDAFLMGRAYLNAEGAENILRATNQFRRATELDPGYLDAWLGLEQALGVYDFWHPDKLKQAQAERKDALAHALKLAPDNGSIRLMYGWVSAANSDMVGANQTFEKVLKHQKLGRCNARTFTQILLFGRIDHNFGRCLIDERERNPTNLSTAEDNQNLSHLIGRDDITKEEYERSKAIPGGPGLGELYAFARAFKSQSRADARAHFRALIDFLPAKVAQFEEVYDNFDDDARALDILNEARADPANQDPTRLIMIAYVLAIYGDAEGAADAMHRHYLDVGGTWWHMLWMPEFADARKQPAFKEIIREKGFERFFRESGEWNDFCRPLSDTDFECF